MNKENFLNRIGQFKKNAHGKVPPLNETYSFLKRTVELLFPILSKKEHLIIESEFEAVEKMCNRILLLISYSKPEADDLSNRFMNMLEHVYNNLLDDAQSIYDGDPAAESIEEVIISYPGFYAITIYRIAHELYKLNIPILPRLFGEYAHTKTGIDIHPGASIGKSFCIDHGTGIVIGETTIIGNHVKLYQGVTLGALSVTKEKAGKKRHPTIEDYVTIYAGSTILGGKTVIGHNSVIGGNAWLTETIEPYSIVLNRSEVFVKNKNPEYDNIIDFVI